MLADRLLFHLVIITENLLFPVTVTADLRHRGFAVFCDCQILAGCSRGDKRQLTIKDFRIVFGQLASIFESISEIVCGSACRNVRCAAAAPRSR